MAKKPKAKSDRMNIVREPFQDLLNRLHINPNKAHYLVVSDGSGSDFSRGCGFGSAVINLKTAERDLLFGAMNQGTVNIAEMLAVLQALDFILYKLDNESKTGGIVRHVHIVTDSKYCETTGNTTNGRMAKRNIGVWTLAESYARRGLVLNWHHAKRSTIGLNILCDLVSRNTRRHLEAYNVDSGLDQQSLGLYDTNPWQEGLE